MVALPYLGSAPVIGTPTAVLGRSAGRQFGHSRYRATWMCDLTRHVLVSGLRFGAWQPELVGDKAMKKKFSSFLGLVHKHLPWALNVAYLAAKVTNEVLQLVNGAANYDAQLRPQVPAEGGRHGLRSGRQAASRRLRSLRLDRGALADASPLLPFSEWRTRRIS